MGLDRYLTQKAPGVFWVAVGEILSPTSPGLCPSQAHKCVLVPPLAEAKQGEWPQDLFSARGYLAKDEACLYQQRRLAGGVPAPVSQVCSCLWEEKSHCHGNLSVERQDGELGTTL